MYWSIQIPTMKMKSMLSPGSWWRKELTQRCVYTKEAKCSWLILSVFSSCLLFSNFDIIWLSLKSFKMCILEHMLYNHLIWFFQFSNDTIPECKRKIIHFFIFSHSISFNDYNIIVINLVFICLKSLGKTISASVDSLQYPTENLIQSWNKTSL